jgi:hypothetical protein
MRGLQRAHGLLWQHTAGSFAHPLSGQSAPVHFFGNLMSDMAGFCLPSGQYYLVFSSSIPIELRSLFMIRCLVTLLILAISGYAHAQRPIHAPSPERDGLRFVRDGAKTPATLAPKAGGPTERIEIQSTDDHIDYVIKTYPLKHANAAEVYELIQLAVTLEGGKVSRVAGGSGCEIDETSLTCKTVFEGESLLVVTVPEWMISYLDATIAALDNCDLHAAAYGTAAIYLPVKHRLPSEVTELIRETSASPYIVLKPDDSRQLLYLEDTPSYFQGDLDAFKTFDVPPPQIETRVRLYELDAAKGKDIGLDWQSWKKSAAGGGFTFRWSSNPGSYDMNLEGITAQLTNSPLLVTEFLNYLTERGRAQIITDTRLTQINGRVATINSTTQVPYVVRGYMDNDVADGPVRDAPEALDADRLIKEFREGLIVEMTPRIADDIELEVKASVSSHVGYTPNQSVPIISSSDLNTVVLLEPGKPAVLGGLTRESVVNERSGIVGLKDVPYLRGMFSREVERKHKGVILLTIELNKVSAGVQVPHALSKKLRPAQELSELMK